MKREREKDRKRAHKYVHVRQHDDHVHLSSFLRGERARTHVLHTLVVRPLVFKRILGGG